MATDGQRPSSAGGPDGVDEHPDWHSDGHPDLDTLALFDAEGLEPHRSERVREHARTCAGCGAALAALREVRAELAALPTPQLPAGVAARLEAALDAAFDTRRRARFGSAPSPRSDPGGAPDPTGDGNVSGLDQAGLRGRRSRRSRARVMGLVAAGAVLLAGVGVGSAALRGSTGTSADQGATSALAPVSPKDHSAGPAHPSLVPSHVFTPHGGAVPGVSEAPGVPAVPRYNRDDIGASLARILADATCAGGSSCGSTSAGAMSDSDLRARCTSELTGTSGVTGSPRAVQFALFEGRPAFVFIFDSDQGTASGTERIVVVGSDCGQAATPEVLFSGP